MKTYIINPDTQKPVSIEEWAKDADPTRAQLLLVDTGEKRMLVRKSFFPGEHNFKDAQEIAAAYKPIPESPFAFRCPTRKESLDLYDARFLGGLDKDLRDGCRPSVYRQQRLVFLRQQRHARHHQRQQRQSVPGGHAFND